MATRQPIRIWLKTKISSLRSHTQQLHSARITEQREQIDRQRGIGTVDQTLSRRHGAIAINHRTAHSSGTASVAGQQPSSRVWNDSSHVDVPRPTECQSFRA